MQNYLHDLEIDLNWMTDEYFEEGCGRAESEVKSFLFWLREEVELFNRYGDKSKVNLEILPKTLEVKRIEKIKSDIFYTFIKKFYKKSETRDLYVLDKTVEMSSTEYDCLCENLIFVRGKIVWVNFGFSIGNEFGGIIPALILGEAGPDELFILPLTNQDDTDENPNYAITEIKCSEPNTWGVARIDELKRISTKRIVTNRDSGNVDNTTLLYLLDRVAKYYGNL